MAGQHHLMPLVLQHLLEKVAEFRLIIHDENCAHGIFVNCFAQIGGYALVRLDMIGPLGSHRGSTLPTPLF
jgi:hypothetical protein